MYSFINFDTNVLKYVKRNEMKYTPIRPTGNEIKKPKLNVNKIIKDTRKGHLYLLQPCVSSTKDALLTIE